MEQERTVQQIDADLEAARAALAQRQEELEAASSKVAEINSEYDAQSISWKNFADRDAKKWLDSADRELFSAQAEVRQLNAAAKALGEQIAKLEREHAEAKRRDVEIELGQEELNTITAALMTDDGVARLLLSIEEILARQKKMLALAQSIGAPTQKYEKIADHLRRAVVWQLFPRTGTWLNKQARAVYEMPISKILENVLRGEGEHWQNVTLEELSDAEREAS